MPRKAMGSLPPAGNPKLPTPPVKFEEIEGSNKARGKQVVSSPKVVKKKSSGGGFSGFLTSHPFQFNYSTKDSRSICRSLAHGKSHLLPIITPVLHSAHQQIDPYTGPYVKAVRPYTQSAWKTAKPYYKQAEKQGKNVYNRHLEPMRKKALKKGKLYVDPHVKNFNKQYKKQVQPHVDNFEKAVKPYQDIYTRDVEPYLSQAYTYSLAAGSTSYSIYVKQIHPHVVSSLHRLHSFYVYHVDPAMRRAYSLYVQPQLERLLAKVYERKVHAQGSEAIASAKQEVKEAAKEGTIRSKEMQAEAEKEAIRKKEDPSMLEKAQQATESFLGMSEEADEIEIARLDAELEAELGKVKEQLEAWESGLSKLVAQEYKLFTERISDLRNRRLADLPDHFASLTETYVEDEVAANLARLERIYKKLSKSDLSVSDQISEANKEHDKQKQKLIASQKLLDKQIDTYAQELETDEVKSLEASVGEVRRYVKESQKSFSRIMDEAKFERSLEDYEGWDSGMMQRANLLEQDLHKLLQGGRIEKNLDAVDLRKEPKLDSHISDLHSRVKKLYSTAVSQVDSYATSGNLQLRGEGTLGAISDATDAVAEQAKALAEGAASIMLEAALTARQKLGIAPKQSQGILERVQLGLQDATKSAASIVGAAPTPKSAGDYVEEYVDGATSLAASMVGYKTEPDSYIEIIGDKAQNIMDAASSSIGDVAKGASDGYEAAVSVLEDGFTAATTSAGNVYKSASSSASDAFTAATTSAGNVYKAASCSVVGVLPTNVASGGDVAASIVGVAQEQFASISNSASKVAESAGASGFSMVEQVVSNVVETGNEGVKQGSHSVQEMYDSVKDGVQGAREAILESSGSVKDAVVGVVTDEDPKLIGKTPDDPDFNTVGKAAEALKDRIVHAEL